MSRDLDALRARVAMAWARGKANDTGEAWQTFLRAAQDYRAALEAHTAELDRQRAAIDAQVALAGAREGMEQIIARR